MRKLFNYPPLILALHLMVGILLAREFNFNTQNLQLIAVLCVTLSVITFLINQRYLVLKILQFVLYGAVLVGIGMISFSRSDERSFYNHYLKFAEKAAEELYIIEVQKVLRSNSSFDRFEAAVIQVGKFKSTGRIIVNVDKAVPLNLEAGFRIMTKAQILPVAEPLNPYEFNYAEFLKLKQIHGQMYLKSDAVQIIEKKGVSLLYMLENFRSGLISNLQLKGFRDKELGVMSALLLGERDFLSTEVRDAYIDAGAIHILAISGLHVGILFLMLSFLLKPLQRLPHGNIVVQFMVLGILWLFAVLAGLSSSVVRAVTMFSFISFGLMLNRRTSVYHSLITSAFVLLLFNPRFLFDVGFQLSYTAVLSIVWLQPKLERLFKPRFRLIHYFWKLLTVSCAAQLGVLPLSLFYFHQFPSLFFVSNIVIIPILGVLLGVGMVILMLTYLNIEFELLFKSYKTIIKLLNEIIGAIAGYEQFIFKNVFWSVGLLIASYAMLISFFKYTERKIPVRFAISCISILVFYGVLVYETEQQINQEEFIVFHRNRTTVIGELYDQELRLTGVSKSKMPAFVDTYISGKGVKELRFKASVPNLMWWNSAPVLVVDSLGLYTYKVVQNPVVLLRNSPKINVDRMIHTIRPTLIIADGSNYKSYLRRWEQSALKTKTPFHATAQKGAFISR